LTGLVTEISQSVKDPQAGVSVFERAKAKDMIQANSPASQQEAMHRKVFEVGAMGSGSDYSAFIQHAGIPALNIGYGGENGGGEYHSIYDSYDDFRRFKDPGFVYCLALAQTAGRAVLRMADADLLPFDYRTLYTTVKGYVQELVKKTDQMRDATASENEVIRSNSYQIAKDPRQPLAAPQIKPEVPYLDFAPLLNAVAGLDKATANWNTRIKNAAKNADDTLRLNKTLYQAEQELLSATGLPRRSWYRHTLYAPGFYTGYGVKTMPGIREAMEQRNWTEAQEQIKTVAAAIGKFTAYISKEIP
ncbi:MAG TPA: transferrin receptor-like dimerization domain-containing protein, partial [Sediminibacterium sp.]|nr:transferrin receptor-like dimerization domain-containing protein [Sediminibacterium sp.]